MPGVVDLYDEVRAIIGKLGFGPDDVHSILIEPDSANRRLHRVKVLVYRRDDAGRKLLRPVAATDEHVFPCFVRPRSGDMGEG